ncbi:MAG: T9SS type A sorting domain-containing protein, partial [Bacteroidales bacterium]|nr:T9SS type A sorting domain-containing protein [Bacteroidales bacterium]
EGELACKLMAALQGAKVIGADTRCFDDGVSSLSTFLRVALPDDPPDDLYLDLNIPSVPAGIDPIDSLQTLVDEWGGCLVSDVESFIGTDHPLVYPNPARDYVHLQIAPGKLRNSTVTFYNSRGEVEWQGAAPADNKLDFDLPAGIYYLHISKNGQHILREKVMVVE